MQVWSSSLIFAAPSNVPLKTCEIVNALPFSAFPLLSCFRTFNPIQGRTWVTLFFVTLFAVAAANVPAPLLLQSCCLVSSKYKPVEKKMTWKKRSHKRLFVSLVFFPWENSQKASMLLTRHIPPDSQSNLTHFEKCCNKLLYPPSPSHPTHTFHNASLWNW